MSIFEFSCSFWKINFQKKVRLYLVKIFINVFINCYFYWRHQIHDGAVVCQDIWSCFIDKIARNCEMKRCPSFYQFITTNWLCVFTAKLLPGRKFGRKFSFQGLLFVFLQQRMEFIFLQIYMKMNFVLQPFLTKMCLFAISQQFS